MTVDRVKAFESLRQALTTAPLLLMPDFNLYIYASGDVLGAVDHEVQIINDKPVEGPIFFIARQIKPTEARYGASQMEYLFLVWALEKLNFSLHILRWKITVQEYRGNITIVHKTLDGLRRWPSPNNIYNHAYVPEEASL
ncbi:hypothetical protein O181_004041 [Austropuccinia psidii MF-1]|uniref:Reverse transcriptase/retrotransposon-derived protein RNase H-like domain-containing protein n=1 Tax=Austropuccinia psidii MF-1 TaxID=1389203 RepID=A0A9Q3BES5_9BASI|nr:hypothetical protein [Austropuccinia psidii MF-1]